MRIALYRSDLNIIALEKHYCSKPGDVIVSRWVRLITTPKVDDPEKLGELVNRHAPHPRYITAKGESIVL